MEEKVKKETLNDDIANVIDLKKEKIKKNNEIKENIADVCKNVDDTIALLSSSFVFESNCSYILKDIKESNETFYRKETHNIDSIVDESKKEISKLVELEKNISE